MTEVMLFLQNVKYVVIRGSLLCVEQTGEHMTIYVNLELLRAETIPSDGDTMGCVGIQKVRSFYDSCLRFGTIITSRVLQIVQSLL